MNYKHLLKMDTISCHLCEHTDTHTHTHAHTQMNSLHLTEYDWPVHLCTCGLACVKPYACMMRSAAGTSFSSKCFDREVVVLEPRKFTPNTYQSPVNYSNQELFESCPQPSDS